MARHDTCLYPYPYFNVPPPSTTTVLLAWLHSQVEIWQELLSDNLTISLHASLQIGTQFNYTCTQYFCFHFEFVLSFDESKHSNRTRPSRETYFSSVMCSQISRNNIRPIRWLSDWSTQDIIVLHGWRTLSKNTSRIICVTYSCIFYTEVKNAWWTVS